MKNLVLLSGSFLAAFSLAASVRAATLTPAGFNEPNVILYGKVTNNLTTPGTPFYTGTLVYTITPAGRTAFTVTTALQSLGGGSYSYELQIPVEKVPPGFRLDAQTLQATTASVNNTVSATINGVTAKMFDGTGKAFPGVVAYSQVARGLITRIDLQFNTNGDPANLDSDHNGLPDAWELQHFGRIGVDPKADADGDGDSNLAKYLAGEDPLCYGWDKWLARNNLAGVHADPAAMPFKDGIPNILAYALGGDPGVTPPAALLRRMVSSVVTDGGKRYPALTIHRPGFRGCHVDYVVETSDNLVNWASKSNVDVVTMVDTTTELTVRSTQELARARNSFMRLRVVFKP